MTGLDSSSGLLSPSGLSIGGIATLACLMEVTASKPGNVNRLADFEDVGFVDFAASAVALGQAIDSCSGKPYGATVLEVAKRTKQVTASNTNLGINLLISLLAKVQEAEGQIDPQSVSRYVGSIPVEETSSVYAAIGMMNPGGMGEVDHGDVRESAQGSILEVMTLARDRDMVAKQFTNGCADVIESGLDWLVEGKDKFGSWMSAIVWSHVRFMAAAPDSLILRKCECEIANKCQSFAQEAVEAGLEELESFWPHVAELDFWLRSDGNRRNPGASADLVAASIFLGLIQRKIEAPYS